jgi:hypothetical protein
MIRRSTFPPRRPPRRLPLVLLAAVVAFQLAVPGLASGAASTTGSRLATSVSLPAASATVDALGVERLDGDAGGRPVASPSSFVRILPVAGSAVADGFCPWRTEHALARAGRAACPPTAPPISRI